MITGMFRRDGFHLTSAKTCRPSFPDGSNVEEFMGLLRITTGLTRCTMNAETSSDPVLRLK